MENSTDGVLLSYEKKSTGQVRAFKGYLWGQHFGIPEAGGNQSDLQYVPSCSTRYKCLHISWESGTELRFPSIRFSYDTTTVSRKKKCAPYFFPFAHKTIESGVLDVKNIVYITLFTSNLIVIDLTLCRIEAELLT